MKEEQEIRTWAILLYYLLYGKKNITNLIETDVYKNIEKFIKDGKLN